jgi:tagatose 1,6-diphosphate aldolase GatY/KbaY
MLTSLPVLLDDARRRRAAVGAFTAYDLETAIAVLHAGARAETGVVILVACNAFAAPGGELLITSLVAAADAAAAPACVQLDHVSDLGLVARAFELGAGAAMADGSRLGVDEHAAWTRQAVALAARHGAAIEAELGRIAGDEDVATAVAAGALTEPAEAAAFVRATGVQCLAVSIGNVHGTYRDPPRLDWPRLEALRATCSGPLSLHGASGLADGDVRRAIGLGIAKVNVNTELREAYLAATHRRLPGLLAGARVMDLHRVQGDAVADVVTAKLATFEPAGDDAGRTG